MSKSAQFRSPTNLYRKVYFVDVLRNPHPRRRVTDGPGPLTTPLSAVRVFEYAEKQAYLDSPIPTGELYAMNIDGSQRELIYGYRAGDQKTGSRISSKDDSKASQEIISFLDNDDDHILIVEYPWTKDGKFYYDRREKPALISRLNVYSGNSSV